MPTPKKMSKKEMQGIRAQGLRGRDARKNDKPSGDQIKKRQVFAKDRTSVITFPMNGSEASKYPANTLKKKKK